MHTSGLDMANFELVYFQLLRFALPCLASESKKLSHPAAAVHMPPPTVLQPAETT